jgi:hypothetical protein
LSSFQLVNILTIDRYHLMTGLNIPYKHHTACREDPFFPGNFNVNGFAFLRIYGGLGMAAGKETFRPDIFQ